MLDDFFSDDPRGHLVLVDYIVTLLAIIANCLVLDGLLNFNRKRDSANSGGHLLVFGYRRFFVSLIVSDLYLCVVNVIAFVYTIYAKHQGQQNEMCVPVKLRSMYHVAFVANLLSLMGMSTDHLIGILSPSVYRRIMSNRVVICAVLFIWIVAIMFGLSDYTNAIVLYVTINFNETEATKNLHTLRSDYLHAFRQNRIGFTNNGNFSNLTNSTYSSSLEMVDDPVAIAQWRAFAFCLLYSASQPWLVKALLILAVLCFVFLLISYAFIFREIVMKLRAGVVNNPSIQVGTIIATTTLLIGAFVVCWLPITIFEFLSNSFPDETASLFGGTEQMLELCLYSMFQCYPLFDAVICTLRLRRVRKYIFDKYCRLLCPCCRHELPADSEGRPMADPGILSNNNGEDAGYELSEL